MILHKPALNLSPPSIDEKPTILKFSPLKNIVLNGHCFDISYSLVNGKSISLSILLSDRSILFTSSISTSISFMALSSDLFLVKMHIGIVNATNSKAIIRINILLLCEKKFSL